MKLTNQDNYLKSLKINNGYELVDLELNEETIEMINLYKIEHNMTFEEAVVDILKKIIDNPEVLKTLD